MTQHCHIRSKYDFGLTLCPRTLENDWKGLLILVDRTASTAHVVQKRARARCVHMTTPYILYWSPHLLGIAVCSRSVPIARRLSAPTSHNMKSRISAKMYFATCWVVTSGVRYFIYSDIPTQKDSCMEAHSLGLRLIWFRFIWKKTFVHLS